VPPQASVEAPTPPEPMLSPPPATPASPVPGEPAAQSASAVNAETAMPPLHVDIPLSERRHPLRFVWQMNPEGLFTLGSDEFAELIGPRIATALGRPWRDIAAEFALDPEDHAPPPLATHHTWTRITASS